MRGRTTQKRVSSTRYGVAPFTASAVTTTSEASRLSAICFTSPTSTLLYLIFVLPASSPSAVLKVIVIVGPCSLMTLNASHPPASAATMGMAQTMDSDQRRFEAATASGRSKSCGASAMALAFLQRVPYQARVKGLCREHRQHHHRAERDRSRSGLDRRQRLELDERGEDRGDVDVHHGPATDKFHHPVQLGALQWLPRRTPLHRDKQHGQREQLPARHHDARDKNNRRQGPRT